jgi:hypothetical protein
LQRIPHVQPETAWPRGGFVLPAHPIPSSSAERFLIIGEHRLTAWQVEGSHRLHAAAADCGRAI